PPLFALSLHDALPILQFWIVPPVPAVVPVPVTVNGPVPVPFTTMPFGAPLAEMLLKVMPAAPIVVPTTLSAIPLPEEMTFGEFRSEEHTSELQSPDQL